MSKQRPYTLTEAAQLYREAEARVAIARTKLVAVEKRVGAVPFEQLTDDDLLLLEQAKFAEGEAGKAVELARVEYRQAERREGSDGGGR